jgi:tetrahydromethanopterin S-methyltransferase subunit F
MRDQVRATGTADGFVVGVVFCAMLVVAVVTALLA